MGWLDPALPLVRRKARIAAAVRSAIPVSDLYAIFERNKATDECGWKRSKQ
jgi:hypothetical protein